MKTNSSFLDRFGRSVARAALAGALAWALTQSASAELKHRYSFTTDGSDSIAGANGTLMNGAYIGTAPTGNAVFLSGATASGPTCDYVELPPGLISNYTTVTFEFWMEAYQNGIWGEVFGFGNQTSGGAGANMLMFCPHSGSSPNDFRMSYAQASPGYNDEYVINGVGVMDYQGLICVTCVYDPPKNSMSLYTNGTLVGTRSPVTTGAIGFSLTNVHNVYSWLGRSLYNGDSSYAGTIDEFRIYNEPLSPLKVYVNSQAGPDTLVANIVVNSLSWNVETNMVVGTRQSSTVTFNTASYGSVTLAGATEANYSSSDPSIVTVNSLGQLFAMAKGSATVSADYNGTTNTVVVTVTDPQLVHRYSFTTDATDSIGSANGTLVGSAVITDGAVVMPGGVTSSDPTASYVDLPNNLVSSLTAITVETWATDNGSANWARVWDLGNSVGGENISDGGTRWMFLSLPSGNGNVMGRIHIDDRGGENTVEWANGGRPPVGQKSHLVYISDVVHRTGWLYVDGVLRAVNNNMYVSPADIGPSVNNWLGRSQYNDPTFNGSIDEFRIYNGPLSALQVAINASSGPDTMVTDPGSIQSVQLSIGTSQVYFGGWPVTAALLANFQNVSNVNVTVVEGAAFQSSNPNVATISSQGVINATGLGQATLIGSYGGQTNTLDITVTTLPNYTPPTLVHRYSFSDATNGTTVKDSVGTADGTIKGVGAAFDGAGQLSLPGGTASNADPSTIAGYVDLPNFMFYATLTNLSIETWTTWQGAGAWQRIFDFGTSAGGEDVSDGNGSYLFLTPLGPSFLRFSVRDPVTGGEPAPMDGPTALAANQEVYIAITYDFADNVARLYSNSVLLATATATVDISTISDVNNWIGRSQWPDTMYQGKLNEFRIWNGILLPDQIALHHAVGPDSLEGPPKLQAKLEGAEIVISWPESAAGYSLQSSLVLGPGASWTPEPTAPVVANGIKTVRLPLGTGTKFFELKK